MKNCDIQTALPTLLYEAKEITIIGMGKGVFSEDADVRETTVFRLTPKSESCELLCMGNRDIL